MWCWGAYPMWGMWWIFPLMGLLFLIVMFFVMPRLCGGRGGFCGARRYDDIENLRREITDLKDEIAKLRERE